MKRSTSSSDGLELGAFLARLLLRIFFQRVELVADEKVPKSGPVVFVANHFNSLIDPALLVGFLSRTPRFLAKSTLWKMLILRPFLALGAAIPVYRRQDPGVDTSQNVETFARCHEVLRDGGAIAIFPEGISHNESGLVPLKTGVSRIVLEAEEKFGAGTRIVPVGLTFDEKSQFRSRALIHVGDALEPSAELELYPEDPRAAVRQLTERVRTALHAVTLNFPSWEEARWIERAAQIFEQPEAELPAERRLSERFPVRKRFIAGYRSLKERHPELVAEAAAAVRDYDQQLEQFQLRDAQVAAEYPASGVLRFVAKSLWLMLVRMPLAILGTVLNVLPYQLVGWLAARRVETPDVTATYKVLASVVFYPITWGLIALVSGLLWGWPWALAALVVAPVSAVAALRFHERRDRFIAQARSFLLLRSGSGRVAEDLRRRRGEILAMVRRLVELELDQS